uniref:Uncharacterized protein n=1 Tax=Euplotes harpa TaxID=151035 RepID=A0A7S3J5Z8_9SPIT|mmetsp:Transcript_16994/g.19597  ORF Transcript_16994/g.19597 Transcript_16994/m.19597 type:complete len:225 (+) Transcript_16994:14-688(+)|eukprot:CAMPEP_0168337062 /NCGR_PEP_ID=MMETSP0213-20121227/11934_1 /TAXON_ID=151035 /ORGANISM="Euplotes harpa, Strain FSP1.4" /LENGTH=224 /DNA_ID=CAMNT_0008342415 /DNA_START=14 /DNA_END=691 /DNA_ORIENTATION=+
MEPAAKEPVIVPPEELDATDIAELVDESADVVLDYKDEETKEEATVDVPSSPVAPSELLKTITKFKAKPAYGPKTNTVSQKIYTTFNANRTAELYMYFWDLVGGMDFKDAKYDASYLGCVPFPGKKNERTIQGMKFNGVMHGVVRYEYKTMLIEECYKDGREHGLRVVCTSMGDVWLRLWKNGNRLAQIVLNADLSECKANAKDDGGLKLFRKHLHVVVTCLKK